MKPYFAKLIGEWNGVVYSKHKLFLCSRDIQVGDKIQCITPSGIWVGVVNKPENQDSLYVYHEDENEEGVNVLMRLYDYFKIIGEISPDATWVKEGDEFGEDDIAGLVALKAYDFDVNQLGYMIKGPCGHFH